MSTFQYTEMITEMEKRKYTLRQRAAKQEETRARIVEAAMLLHEELGPRATTISAVAERSGVQRLTVYRHFPDESALFEACTGHWFGLHPPPDPAEWQALETPPERLRGALSALCRYYRGTAPMWRGAYRDLAQVPALAAPMARFEAYLASIRDELMAGLGTEAQDALLRASLAHLLRFGTWDSLQREGLDDDTIAGLGSRWVACLTAAGDHS